MGNDDVYILHVATCYVNTTGVVFTVGTSKYEHIRNQEEKAKTLEAYDRGGLHHRYRGRSPLNQVIRHPKSKSVVVVELVSLSLRAEPRPRWDPRFARVEVNA